MAACASRFIALLIGTTLSCGASAAARGDFSFDIVGETFTYTDSERTFTGRILFPPGPGPFPAIVFNHGQGGSPNGYPNVTVMRDWGAVVIAPTLTHVFGGETSPPTTGHTPENRARGIACVDALSADARVDPQRIAMFGHSKGAYATIGQVSALGNRILVAGMSAGGVIADSAGTGVSPPTFTEAAGVVAPFIMFHGNIDPWVSPSFSQSFVELLTAANVPNQRIVYDVSALPPEYQHNLHQTPSINDDMMTRLHDWYTQWGLFGAQNDLVFADGFEIAGATMRVRVPNAHHLRVNSSR